MVPLTISQGNEKLSDHKIKGGLFSKGAFAKTHEAGKLSSFLKAKKFTPERYRLSVGIARYEEGRCV